MHEPTIGDKKRHLSLVQERRNLVNRTGDDKVNKTKQLRRFEGLSCASQRCFPTKQKLENHTKNEFENMETKDGIPVFCLLQKC